VRWGTSDQDKHRKRCSSESLSTTTSWAAGHVSAAFVFLFL
jgi:hypothetical protein